MDSPKLNLMHNIYKNYVGGSFYELRDNDEWKRENRGNGTRI